MLSQPTSLGLQTDLSTAELLDAALQGLVAAQGAAGAGAVTAKTDQLTVGESELRPIDVTAGLLGRLFTANSTRLGGQALDKAYDLMHGALLLALSVRPGSAKCRSSNPQVICCSTRALVSRCSDLLKVTMIWWSIQYGMRLSLSWGRLSLRLW